MWTNDETLGERLHQAGKDCDELIWPMPLLPQFEKEMTDSKIADVRNLVLEKWWFKYSRCFFETICPKRT